MQKTTPNTRTRITLSASILFILLAALYFLPLDIPYKTALPLAILTIMSPWILPWQMCLAMLFSAAGDAAGAYGSFILQISFFALVLFVLRFATDSSTLEKAIVATDRGQPFDNHVTFENGTGADANVRPHHAKRSDLNIFVKFGSNINNAGMMDFGHDYPFAGPLEPISSSNKKMSPLPRENARAKLRPHFVVKP